MLIFNVNNTQKTTTNFQKKSDSDIIINMAPQNIYNNISVIIPLKDLQVHTDDVSNTSELYIEPEKTLLTGNEENIRAKKVKTKSGPIEKSAYYKIISDQLSRVEQGLSSKALPLKNELSLFDDAIRR